MEGCDGLRLVTQGGAERPKRKTGAVVAAHSPGGGRGRLRHSRRGARCAPSERSSACRLRGRLCVGPGKTLQSSLKTAKAGTAAKPFVIEVAPGVYDNCNLTIKLKHIVIRDGAGGRPTRAPLRRDTLGQT